MIRHIAMDLQPDERFIIGNDPDNKRVILLVENTRHKVGHCHYIAYDALKAFTSDLKLIQCINEGIAIVRRSTDT